VRKVLDHGLDRLQTSGQFATVYRTLLSRIALLRPGTRVMSSTRLLHDGPPDGPSAAAGPWRRRADGLAVHGHSVAGMIAAHGIRVVRFEFAYMAARQSVGAPGKPPSRMPVLLDEFRAVLDQLPRGPCLRGWQVHGRTRGHPCWPPRPDAPDQIAGVVCLGYPFHPPGKPDKMRTAHLPAHSSVPVLIAYKASVMVLAPAMEVAGWEIPAQISFHWAPHGNHDLVPPKRSGLTDEDNWSDAARAIAGFMAAQIAGATL
jgi:predicted alpha/beta-hydrolase family hydrolase